METKEVRAENDLLEMSDLREFVLLLIDRLTVSNINLIYETSVSVREETRSERAFNVALKARAERLLSEST